jgi:hypothetical protein
MQATAIEPIRGELNPGDKVITKLAAATAQQGAATRSLMPGPQGPGNQRR